MGAVAEKPWVAGVDAAPEPGLFDARPRLLLAALVGVLLLGTLVRVHYSAGPGTASDRQYRSYLISRALYLAGQDDVPDWRKHVAATSARRQEPLEPPITDHVVAAAYRALGRESLRLARLVPAAFWMLGALPLFLLARRVGGADGALIAALYYVLVPSGVLISVSLLPEGLMITSLATSLLLIVLHFERPSVTRLLAAIVVSALTIVVKPFAVVVIPCAIAALAIHGSSSVRGVLRPATLALVTLSILPGAIYYGYGIVVADYMRWKVGASFLPHLLWSADFWIGCLQSGMAVAGATPLAAALLGVALLRGGRSRALIVGLGAGYALFCLMFNYYTRAIHYYHAQLIVIVALALSPLGPLLVRTLRPTWAWPWTRPLIMAALSLVVVGSVYSVGNREFEPKFAGREVAEVIGKMVGHSDRVAYVAHVYGLPLEYYGELAGEAWPRPLYGWPRVAGPERPRTIEERLPMLGFVPHYFVITDFHAYERDHRDLRDFLAAFARPVAEKEDFLIYEMTDEWHALMERRHH